MMRSDLQVRRLSHAVGAAVTGINITSIIVAFVGAVILLAILRAIGGRGTTL